MNKTTTKRIRVTKTGKLLRRPKGLGHSRANKTARQKVRKRGYRIYAAG